MSSVTVTDPIRLAGLAPPRPEYGGPPLDPEAAAPIPGQMTFDEFLRGLNPLHHLPVVGTIYRAATGETIPPPMRVLGNLALGGVPGALPAAVAAMIEETKPMERLHAALAGRPDPLMPEPDPASLARALAAYGGTRDGAA